MPHTAAAPVKPLLTVVTVILNIIKNKREISFRNCIESTASQTWPGIEHLVIDGGSTDGTVELLQDLQKNGKIRFISEKDRGIYDAMNKGIRNASGKYIMFLNSDDAFLDNSAVENVIPVLEKENADYSYADAEVYAANHSSLLYTWKGTILDIPYGYYPCHQTFFAKKSVLEQLGGFHENYMANDNLLMLQIVSGNWKGVYIPRSIIAFHVGGASGEMIQAKEPMKAEHIAFFTKECGLPLSAEELSHLYEKQFYHLPYDQVIKIGSHLGKPEWIQSFFSSYLEFVYNQAKAGKEKRTLCKIRLFSCLPFFAFTRSE